MMKVVTLSSCESEYVGLSELGNEAIYLQQLQEELGIGKPSVLLLGDNESSLKLLKILCDTRKYFPGSFFGFRFAPVNAFPPQGFSAKMILV